MHTDPAKLKRGRISRAIIAILMLAVFNLVGFIFFFIMSHNNHLELLTQQVIVDSEHSFNTIESDKLRYLNTTLALLMANRAIANAFKERDREALLALCLPLFNHIKRNNGITHWYFHEAEPDKRCFLRIHKPDLYGDRITRITFDRAIETKQLASGKELGKTALAIRAVHPFYLDEALIGYIELGVDIDYLFRNFVATTGNHYGLFVEKSLLDRFKWDSVRSVKRLRDSWDDHNRYLLLYQTPLLDRIDPDLKKGNFIGAIPDQAKAFNRIVRGRNAYSRGMFPFYDVLGRKIGAVYILRNFNQHVSLVRSKSMFFIVMTFLFVGIVTFLMVFLHKRGERKLKKYRNLLEELVAERTQDLTTVNRQLEAEIREHKKNQIALIRESEARSEAERKQLLALKQLEEHSKMASIGVLAAGITHEINQPLNAIKVTSDSIGYWHRKNPGQLPEVFVGQMDLISKSVGRISNIITQMRDFWGDRNVKGEVVELNEVIQSSTGFTTEQIRAHEIDLQLDLWQDPMPIEGNRIHLEQVLINLIVNAIHALDTIERKDKMISIKSWEDKGRACILIRDNGPGLPTDNEDELFDLFYTKARKSVGMGLGLAIVKRYVEKYKGTINIKKFSGAGTAFQIGFVLAGRGKHG